jgi:hypothetical protein
MAMPSFSDILAGARLGEPPLSIAATELHFLLLYPCEAAATRTQQVMQCADTQKAPRRHRQIEHGHRRVFDSLARRT